MADMRNNWNDEWSDVLSHAAKIASGAFRARVDLDDLANAAWLDSVRRLPVDADLNLVMYCAIRSMKQHMCGGKSMYAKKAKFNREMSRLVIENDAGELENLDAASNGERFCYDDVDEIVELMDKLNDNQKHVMFSVMTGKPQRKLSSEMKVSPGMISRHYNDAIALMRAIAKIRSVA